MADALEAQIQQIVVAKQLRPSEFFKDYDRLRTGFVTRSQFQRCIVINCVGLSASDDQFSQLCDKYDLRFDGTVHYRSFQDSLNRLFAEPDLEKNPLAMPSQSTSLLTLGVDRLKETLPDQVEDYDHFQDVLQAIREYSRSRGLTVRDAYAGFDKVNRGQVTVQQFIRNLPAPSTLDHRDKEMLALHYRLSHDPLRVNYFSLMQDLDGTFRSNEPLRSTLHRTNAPSGSGGRRAQSGAARDREDVVDKLRVAVHKARVRPLEFFRDYDKLKKGVITANQFQCGLALAMSGPNGLVLSRDEIAQVSSQFANDDGSVRYPDFCKAMESAGDIDLERLPLGETAPLSKASLVSEVNQLSDDEEDQLAAALDRLQHKFVTEGIDILTIFREADRKFGYTKGVTKDQFLRVINPLRLPLSDKETKLIFKKFTNPRTGHVNYQAFLASADPTFSQPSEQLYFDKTSLASSLEETHRGNETRRANAVYVNDINAVLNRIKRTAIEKSLRVSEFFRDHDRLHTGRVTPAQFTRGLKQMEDSLSAADLLALEQHYTRAALPTSIVWVEFERDIESLFTDKTLTQNPGGTVRPLSDTARELRLEAMSNPADRGFDSEKLKEVDTLVAQARTAINRSKFDLETHLKDYDKNRRGYITVRQLINVLELGKVDLTTRQLETFCQYYQDERGIDYRRLVDDLIDYQPLESLHHTRLAALRAQKPMEDSSYKLDAAGVLLKLKTENLKKRVRVLEFFKDYDKLRSGKISSSQFVRGLNMSQLSITPNDLDTLVEHYKFENSNEIDYQRFSRDMEETFVDHSIEKAPMQETARFERPHEIDLTSLTNNINLKDDDYEEVNNLLVDMANHTRVRGYILKPFFADFDKSRRNAISSNQFTRVLNDLGLSDNVKPKLMDKLLKKYSVQLGGRIDVHYKDFCNDVEVLMSEMHKSITES